ncbi:cyclomaltodextrinase N-terminal domain-containing protein [Microvirga sp. STR05]|uniref:Cyclomaltodextrinase N-terminal domain-containing protein n=1 Tax=Hymenobacter duratus TaxID=2771356 RepID=A0ABR8JER8_9BACT|nr:alpha-amylase family glycosyl hydrolase [Hymenobacter duratus]MBD2715357.1 cyclomaltodextrinase N-terminal domain-containing protein [Hymenobacter duratus]MBR7950264.1 cyclomaltodextrinase N-terminal domain-containing protein [Microvirga sp. STR05]
MKKPYLFLLALLLPLLAVSQTPAITRLNPTNWWVGMKYANVQLLVYGPQAGTLTYSVTYPGVKLTKTNTVENPNYAFLDLSIAPTAKPGIVRLVGKKGTQTVTQNWELKARDNSPKAQGVTQADFIYLAMPDRFANGDPTNDKFADMADPSSDRANPFLRHGGDLLGAAQHIGYLKDLGVTAVWFTPVIENDQSLTDEGGAKRSAYHGYGFTDHYNVDRRLGGNAAYKTYVQQAHAAGLKVVQDAVYNHVGNNHWFIKDLPMKTWLHQWPTYTNTSYRQQPITDPHAAQIDRRVTLDGWFVPFLPDLNQQNPYVANFLIQHALWSVEMFGVDAWRIDTYMYNDQPFMNRCNAALLAEYPRIHIFGESSVSNVVDQAYYVRNKIDFPFKSNQPGGLDFVLENAMLAGLKEVGGTSATGWDNGVQRVYQALAQDAVYQDPGKLVSFLDNHDHNRYLSEVGEDISKYKMGLTWLLTTRGIPSMYYGTEILMKNFKDPSDAEVRRDFPGGWPGDAQNKFMAAGRTAPENDAFSFVRTLATYRRTHPALHSGKLMQYLPQDGLYVYFRYDASGTVMVATNSTDKAAALPTARFSERMSGFSKARNVLTNEALSSLSTIQLPAKTALVLELQR